jgi:nucleoid-associated protein EbfC
MLGKLNLGSLMKGAKKIQDLIEKNQQELAKTEITGEAGAGLVKVTMNGLLSMQNLTLADEFLSEPKEVIEELIVAACNNAIQKAGHITQNNMPDLGQLLGDLNNSHDDKTD